MPQVFKIGSYLVYFWSNESKPLEPIQVLQEALIAKIEAKV